MAAPYHKHNQTIKQSRNHDIAQKKVQRSNIALQQRGGGTDRNGSQKKQHAG
jgi:hypothetical protein